ncbi:RDD family protein [Aeromicrobium sp. Sec7.5]|uniref:RDD family protein n=1 Tax=Aeromicrobium sp. Sec7.5 TaxID=3121276 RepID=UPI002FE443A8
MTAAPPPAPGTALASWGARLGAYIIDILPLVIVLVVLTAAFGENEATSTSFSFQLNGLPALLYFVLAIGWLVVNWGLLQGRRGGTVGKSVLGIAVHKAGTGRPLGVGPSIARQLLHIVDALPCYLGFLWPLWDKENRTFADMIMGTRVAKR